MSKLVINVCKFYTHQTLTHPYQDHLAKCRDRGTLTPMSIGAVLTNDVADLAKDASKAPIIEDFYNLKKSKQSHPSSTASHRSRGCGPLRCCCDGLEREEVVWWFVGGCGCYCACAVKEQQVLTMVVVDGVEVVVKLMVVCGEVEAVDFSFGRGGCGSGGGGGGSGIGGGALGQAVTPLTGR